MSQSWDNSNQNRSRQPYASSRRQEPQGSAMQPQGQHGAQGPWSQQPAYPASNQQYSPAYVPQRQQQGGNSQGNGFSQSSAPANNFSTQGAWYNQNQGQSQSLGAGQSFAGQSAGGTGADMGGSVSSSGVSNDAGSNAFPAAGATYVFDKKYENDPFQREVISLDSGYHLVLAPPGCGKTDILAERVVRALALGMSQDKMLCLTFTNRAARGMRERILQRLGLDSDGNEFEIFVGNVHRFCAHFLFNNNILPSNVTIIDEQDTSSIIKTLSGDRSAESDWDEDIPAAQSSVRSNKEEERQRNLALKLALELQHSCYQISHGCAREMYLHADSVDFIRDVLVRNGIAANRRNLMDIYNGDFAGIRYWDVINERFNHWNPFHILQLAKLYEEYKQDHNLVDFDDLLVMAYAHASTHRDELQLYRWIQIDEMQDLSPFQFGLVDLFTDHAQGQVTLYLGDEQQAIFSFIGAKLETLGYLKNRCGQNIHRLYRNYRSPKYLLDIFNLYAQKELQVDPAFLPSTTNETPPHAEDLVIRGAFNKDAEAQLVAQIARFLNQSFPQERLAVLVNANKDADLISQSLVRSNLPHFKISGTDLFTLKRTKMIFAHLSVLNSEFKTMAWCRLLTGFKLKRKASEARDFISDLKRYALLPTDLLCYENSSYLLELQRCCQGTYVIFDTETTGLDVFSNDIVQIAALKIQGKNIIDRFNLILETQQKIPEFLGDLENPLVAEYASREHVSRAEGLQAFLNFVGSCPMIGHNVEYDYHILDNNLQRDCGYYGLSKDYPVYFDTLKAIRIIKPNLKQYKLKFLLEELNLQGENSHLADDDIVATKSLLDWMMYEFSLRQQGHEDCLRQNAAWAQNFKQSYVSVYQDAKRRLYLRPHKIPEAQVAQYQTQQSGLMQSPSTPWVPLYPTNSHGVNAMGLIEPNEPVLVSELKSFAQFCLDRGYFVDGSKLNYIFNFLDKDVIKADETPSLYEQLNAHIVDLNTFREADLCEGTSITEKIFVSTVHKAKGLEFESVIVFEAVKDVYPHFNQKTYEQQRESARLFYVAMTRAKKRLLITYSRSKEFKGEQRPVFQTPFLNSIRSYFSTM